MLPARHVPAFQASSLGCLANLWEGTAWPGNKLSPAPLPRIPDTLGPQVGNTQVRYQRWLRHLKKSWNSRRNRETPILNPGSWIRSNLALTNAPLPAGGAVGHAAASAREHSGHTGGLGKGRRGKSANLQPAATRYSHSSVLRRSAEDLHIGNSGTFLSLEEYPCRFTRYEWSTGQASLYQLFIPRDERVSTEIVEKSERFRLLSVGFLG